MSAEQSVMTASVGGTVRWASRVWSVVALWSDDQVVLQDTSSNTMVTALAAEVQPVTAEAVSMRAVGKLNASEADWNSALKTYGVIKRLSEDPQRTKRQMAAAAAELGVTRATVYARLAQYAAEPYAETFLPRRRGLKRGTRLLPKRTEDIIADTIADRHLTRNGLKGKKFITTVQRLCRQSGIKPPCRAAILRRLEPFKGYAGLRARHGSKKADDRLSPRPGSHDVDRPLQEVQIDHTLVDIIAVTCDEHRDAIGRPWLTLAMDICTRLILGYYLGYEHPNAYSVGLATATACFEKAPLLHAMGIDDVEWGAQGVMKTILLDNAREHKADSYVRACKNRGIQVRYRGQPYYGGHIERLIGTAMRSFHALPGTTRESVEKRGDYHSEGMATMTFDEINRFLIQKFCAYNHAAHSALDQSPWSLWHARFTRGDPPNYCAPKPLDDPEKFLFDLMPHATRVVRRDGLHLFDVPYWTPELRTWVRHQEKVRVLYDPRDISRVYLPVLGATAPLTIPVADFRFPRISVSEWRKRKQERRVRGRNPTELALSDAYEDRADAIVARAVVSAKKAKKLRKREEATRTTNATVDAWHKAHDLGRATPATQETVEPAEEALYADFDAIPVIGNP